ncbi:galactoside 2-alpha-L-fucosyltransferase-like [Selaginella moellendorffii]|uniref:galactoside 2-alpha-L-fucosyltransferase-like n=1 Tax=Selaginella moellendorffii TaxID=88036 RepID=UPI000D1CF718|nr:galactoside 2-alpha-L-fucosyltransferase-like [Selaginella moellendorffii]|eukprot:XP_024528795.1 galactoside 2-alpha-L-fucosyltransferase-like [Selaginella moellendorffii]
MAQLFCEPFPTSSWFLSTDFPIYLFNHAKHRLQFDNCKGDLKVQGYGLIEIIDSFDGLGDKFFCEHEQQMLSEKIPWLAIVVNLYFIPSLYNVPSFKLELDMLFPEQETVFHHLGRYLFHPSNQVWSRTVRIYEDYIANASKVVGIQMRLLEHLGSNGHEHFLNKMIDCAQDNGLLPKSIKSNNSTQASRIPTQFITAIVTSLDGMYFKRLRELYLNSAEDGSLVRVFTPSQENEQKVDNQEHEEKALAEMFLLSFCDELITSPGSTFGYVGHGLAGIKPWILDNKKNCSKMVSLEPCFHAKVTYGCKCMPPKDALSVQHNIQSCQDVTWGIQLKSIIL